MRIAVGIVLLLLVLYAAAIGYMFTNSATFQGYVWSVAGTLVTILLAAIVGLIIIAVTRRSA